MSAIGKETFQIRAQEIDQHKRATVSALIGLMQEAAWNNAEALDASVYQLQDLGISWVLTRLKLELFAYPKHRDFIQVWTWPSGHERTFVYRDYRIFDEAGELIGQATSTWLVLDLKTRRMTRVPEQFHLIIDQPKEVASLPRASGRWRMPKEGLRQVQFPVRWHDLDSNRHVSNFFYFQWPLEALPESLLAQKQLRAIDLIIRSEGLREDEILSIAAEVSPDTYLHSIRRAKDGKELATAQTVWQPMTPNSK